MLNKKYFYDLAALDTLGGKLVFIAAGAVDVILLGDEALGPDGVAADAADEAALVPLPRLVLHLLHARLHQPRRQLGSARCMDIVNTLNTSLHE